MANEMKLKVTFVNLYEQQMVGNALVCSSVEQPLTVNYQNGHVTFFAQKTNFELFK